MRGDFVLREQTGLQGQGSLLQRGRDFRNILANFSHKQLPTLYEALPLTHLTHMTHFFVVR